MWKKLSLYVCLITILCSCQKQRSAYAPPTFPEVKKIHAHRLSDELLISYPLDMAVSEDYIFILALADNAWLQVYDKTTGQLLGSFVTRGQGPGEATTANMCYYNAREKKIFVYDESSMKLLTYQFDKDADNWGALIEERSFYDLGGTLRRVWELRNGRFLVDGQLGTKSDQQKRFQMLADAKVVADYNDFPIDTPKERSVWSSPAIAISPDCKKMAVGTLYGGILELFDLSQNIELRAIRKFYPPVVQYLSGTIQNTEETVWGFSALCATDERIYSVFIGNKNPNLFNNLSVFDWDGRELIKYNTDCLVLRICASTQEPNKLYGIAFSETHEFYLVSFSLGS